MSSLQFLSRGDRAAFAVTSRLLSCLITESLRRALFVPLDNENAVGACIVLSKQASAAGLPIMKPYRSADIFVIVPLRAQPILKPSSNCFDGKEIGLVDPLDMLPWIYEVQSDPDPNSVLTHDLPSIILSSLPLSHYDFTGHTTLSLSLDPLYVWKKFSTEIQLASEIEDEITQELKSSFEWQKYAYENVPKRPTFLSSSLEWEQALIEGHPTHPMHRARRMVPPLPSVKPGQYDYYYPHVRFIAVPRSNLNIQGNFEEILSPLRNSAVNNAGRPFEVPEDHVVFPVHELQIPNIADKLKDAKILPEEYRVLTPAQASIRTMTLPCSPNISLKVALGLKISSALRTISHFTAYSGPRFGHDIVPLLAIDPNVLILENEPASIIYNHEDPEVAKHCTAILREVYDAESKGERVIIAAALAEFNFCDNNYEVPTVTTAFELDTEDKRFDFLQKYVNLIFDAFIPPLLINGIAFEAHGQNTLVRFDKATKELKGFVFRDFGGLRIHQPTLLESTGTILNTLPGHCIIVDDVRDAHKRLYHTLIHSHLHRLIRVLGFHYNGRGWRLVKSALESRIPKDTELWQSWLNPERLTVMGKCLLRMKLQGLYRDAVYEAVPNLIHFGG